MAKDKFTRGKPLCNVRIIGASKSVSTLTDAICKVFDGKHPIANSSSYIEIETESCIYALGNNYTGQNDYVKDLITNGTQINGLIIAISAKDGLTPQIREQILLAHQVGISKIVVFLDNVDKVDDPELLDLVEMEIRELLSRCGFDGDSTPIVRGSAQKALNGDAASQGTIKNLIDACDSYIPRSPGDANKPFLMAIEDVFMITGRGTVATGRIERGTVHLNDRVACIGLNKDGEYIVTGIEMFRKLLDEAQPGDNVGILLRGADKQNTARGMVLATPGSIFAHTRFRAEIYLLTKDEGGRHTPIMNGYRPQFFFRTIDVTGTMQLPKGTDMLTPGSNATIVAELILPIAMEKGTRFAIREGGRTVGFGIVTELLGDIPASKPIATVNDVFTITGRGTVVVATIKSGVFHVGDIVKPVNTPNTSQIGTITSIDRKGTKVNEGKAGDSFSILVRGASRQELANIKELTTLD